MNNVIESNISNTGPTLKEIHQIEVVAWASGFLAERGDDDLAEHLVGEFLGDGDFSIFNHAVNYDLDNMRKSLFLKEKLLDIVGKD